MRYAPCALRPALCPMPATRILLPRNPYPQPAPIKSILSLDFELSALSYQLARNVLCRNPLLPYFVNSIRNLQSQIRNRKSPHHASSIQHRVSSIEYPESSIEHPASSIQFLSDKRADVSELVLHGFHDHFKGIGFDFQALPGEVVQGGDFIVSPVTHIEGPT